MRFLVIYTEEVSLKKSRFTDSQILQQPNSAAGFVFGDTPTRRCPSDRTEELTVGRIGMYDRRGVVLSKSRSIVTNRRSLLLGALETRHQRTLLVG